MKKTILIFMVSCLIPMSVSAATIALKTEKIACRSSEVTLADVATVTAQPGENLREVETLKQIVVCPAPISGKMRVLKYTDIRNVLGIRGIPVNTHFFTGAAQVMIVTDNQDAQSALQDQYGSELEQEIAGKIAFYLKQTVAGDVPWKVTVTLAPEHREIVARCGRIRAIRGGKSPFTGHQIFELGFSETDPQTGENIIIKIGVEVQAPPMTVMAKKSISRGTIIGPSDVTLAFPGENKEIAEDVMTRLEDVIGKEAAVSIRKGAILTNTQIEKPLLVKRNDVVTVYVKNQGITIKTVGKSKQEGRLDDEIVIEPLQKNRKPFSAKIVDFGVAEIQPTITQASDTADRPTIRQVGHDSSHFIEIE